MTPEIILGSPGCGKTTALLSIVEEELARGTPPDRIAYVTFTKRAAEEAITRAVKKFSLIRSQFPYFKTLHALCYHQLGVRSGDVINFKRLTEFADWIGVRLTGRWSEDGSFSGYEIGDRILFMENLARVRMISLREQYDLDDDGLSWSSVDHVARAYAAYKEQHGLIDFTGMLNQFLKSGIKLKIDVLLDDEAQDQSRLQWAVIRKLAASARRVAIGGDDDQALYKWAGADVENFVDLPGQVRVLGQSWRVPRLIQKAAGDIINSVSHRRPKAWAPRSIDGAVEHAASFEEVDCSQGQILILARNIYLLREQIEPALRRAGIIYEYNGHSSVAQSMLNAIVAWEKLRAGESLTAASARGVYEYMSVGAGVTRGFKKLPAMTDDEMVDIKTLQAKGGLLRTDVWHEALDRLPPDEVSYVLAARQRGEKLLSEPRVKISTIHGAKGGEADHVVLLKEMAKRSYREMDVDEDSEKRVFYVGVTRAKEKLTIVEATTQQSCPWL